MTSHQPIRDGCARAPLALPPSDLLMRSHLEKK